MKSAVKRERRFLPHTSTRDVFAPYLDLSPTVHVLCLGTLLNRAGSFVFLFLTIYVSGTLGYEITFAANCFGVFGIGSIIASLVGGQLADRIGRKPVMLFALLGAATSLVVLSSVSNKYVFLAMVFVFALTADMYRPAASAMLSDLTTTEQRPIAFGLMYISYNLGFAVAAPIGGFLASVSFQLLFWGDAITTAAYGLIVAMLVKETLSGQATADRKTVGFIRSIKHIAVDNVFLMFAVATLLTSIVFMQAFTMLPVYMKELGYSEALIGWLLAVNGVLIVFLQIPVTGVLRRYHRVLVILTGELLIAIGFGLTTFAGTIAMFLLTIVIWTMGEVVQAAFKQSLVADMAPEEMRGRYMGAFSLCHALGLALGAPIGGQVLSRWGATTLWSGSFFVVMIAVTIYGLIYLWHSDVGQLAAVDP